MTMFSSRPARHVALWVALMASPLWAWAQNRIVSVDNTRQSGVDVIRVEFDKPLTAVPKGFQTHTPPRIVIDLPDTESGLARSVVSSPVGNITSVQLAQGGDRTRLVLSLKQPTTYTASLDGKALLLALKPKSGLVDAEMNKQDTVRFSETRPASVQPIKELDFRRGADGSGRVILDLASTQMGVDIRQQGQSLVLELPKAALPSHLNRRWDVTDFGTPIQSFTASQSGEKVRIVVEPRGNWEHSAYQTDERFVLEVRPVKQDPNKLLPGPTYSGEPVTFDFQNIPLRQLLHVFADVSNLNVVISDGVEGTATLRLFNVPWDQALDVLLEQRGLGVKKNGNILRIAPKEAIANQEQAELEARKKIQALEPLRTQAFQLNYTKANEVAKALSGEDKGGMAAGTGGGEWSDRRDARLLSPRGSIVADVRTNQLFVTDIAVKLEAIQDLISKLDVPIRQVQIEARIVSADDQWGRSLGVKLGGVDTRGIRGGVPGYNIGGSNYVTIGGNMNAVNGQVQAPGSAINMGDTNFVNMPAFGVLGGTPGTIAATIFSPSQNRALNLELSALESSNRGKVVQSPRVTALNQTKALVAKGEQVPYQRATNSGATAVEYKDATLRLEVTPQITPEGNLILDVEINNDSVGILTPAGYSVKKQQLRTTVLVENGGTAVIGGIYIESETNAENKVPLLGDLPVVGNLFKSRTKITDRSELLIFLTPRILTELANLR